MGLRLATLDDAEASGRSTTRGHDVDGDLLPRPPVPRRPAGLAGRAIRRAGRARGRRDGRSAASRRSRRGVTAPPTPTTVEDSVYVHRDHQGQGSGGPADRADRHRHGPRLPRLHGTDRGRPRGVDRPPPRLRVRGGRHRARSRAQVRPLARRRPDGDGCSRDPADTFPRQQAAHAAVHARRPAERHGRARRAPGGVPAAAGPRTRHRRCGCSTCPRATSGGGRPAALLAGDPTDLPPRSGCGASGPGRARRGSPATPPTPPPRGGRRAAGHLVVADLATRHGGARRRSRARDRPPARPDGRAGGVGATGAALGRSTSTTRPRPGCWPARTTPRSAGASRSSSPPRRWTATAATGGRPTAPRCSSPGSTTRPVQRWWIADPAHPDQAPTEVAYPAAGTPNADVTAWILRLDGTRTEVTWDRVDLPYLAEAAWDAHGPLLALQPRDQRRSRCAPPTPRSARPRRCGPTATRGGSSGPREPRPASPTAGCVVRRRSGTRRLVVDGTPVTPDDLHVRAVAHVGDDRVFTANPIDDATGSSCGDGPTTAWPLTADDAVHAASSAATRSSCAGVPPQPRPHGVVVGGPAIATRSPRRSCART